MACALFRKWSPENIKYPAKNVKEIAYETSHLPSLKYRLIRACVIGQEPLLATNQSTCSVLEYKYKRKKDISLLHTQQTVQVDVNTPATY